MPRIARLGRCFLQVCGASGWINAHGMLIANYHRSSGAERHMNTW
jgi:hypothetical protein